MVSVERELGEIKTKIEFLTAQNKDIFIVIADLKESSVVYNEQIKNMLTYFSKLSTTKIQCDKRFESIENGLSSKLLTSIGAIITSILAFIFVFFR